MAKQDVTVELFYGGQWNSATARKSDPITISRGKGNEQSEPTPATLQLTLDNLDGIYNPKSASSPLYGLAGRNTPIRVQLDGNARFYGEVSSWNPARTENFAVGANKGDSTVSIEAGGVLRRLEQGNNPKSALRLAIEREPNLIAYWPMEDGTASEVAANAVIGGPPIRIQQGVVDFQTDNGPAGSAGYAAVVESPSGFLSAQVPVYSHTDDEWSLSLWAKGRGLEVFGTYDEVTIAAVTTSNGYTYKVGMANAGSVSLDVKAFVTVFDPAGSLAGGVLAQGSNYPGTLDGGWHLIEIEVSSASGGLVYLYVDGESVGSSAISGAYSRPETISMPQVDGLAEVEELGIAHVAFFKNENRATVDLWPIGNGYIGETAVARLTRVCAQRGVAFTHVTVDGNQTMGIQPPDTVTKVLADVEVTDSGILFDSRGSVGLTYRTGRSLYKQDAALALDFSAGYVVKPLEPVLDDQRTRNDVTAKRYRGSSYRVVQETGPNNVQDPTDDPYGVGRVETTVNVNPASDDDLRNHAYWHLHFGTNDEIRYPRVTIEVDNAPALLTDINAVDIGDLITISNLPTDISHDMARLIVLGYTEVIESHRRRITFNCAPASLYDIGEWNEAAGVTSTRWGSSTAVVSTIDSPPTSTSTTIRIELGSGGRFTTNASHYPIDLDINGERVRATAQSPVGIDPTRQEFTVTRSINGVVKAHAVGTPVSLWQPALYGL